MPIAIATGPSRSTPTSTVSSLRGSHLLEQLPRHLRARRPSRSAWRAGSSVALRVSRLRFSPRASGTIRFSHSSSLIFRSRVPETPAEAGSTRARARAPASSSSG